MWQLSESVAQLEGKSIRAKVDLRKPDRGLHELKICDLALSGMHLLGVNFDNGLPANSDAIADAYIRGNDLVVVYEGAEKLLRSQLDWREVKSDRALWAVDLIVSIQTPLLDSNPSATATSKLSADSVRKLDADGTRAVLLRLPGGELSYLQILDEADLCESNVTTPSDATPEVEMDFKLFPERLEKGVIRRGRIRAMILPQIDDELVAQECVNQFVTAAPPLTT